MPSPLTPEQQGRQILDVYASYHCKAGEGLYMPQFQTYWATNHLNPTDFEPGLIYAGEQEWIENGPNDFILLTAKGYEAV